MEDLQKWVETELAAILQIPATEELAKCIVQIESPRDVEDYVRTLVDPSIPAHEKFVKELVSRKQLKGYFKKPDVDTFPAKASKDKKKGGRAGPKKGGNGEPEKELNKKKKKFVNVLNDNHIVLLKGRHKCECQAAKHALVNNCSNCGRIVCEQEGPGPCFFCDQPVNSRSGPNYTENIDSGLKSALELKEKLLEYDKSSEKRTKVIDDQSDYFSTNSVWLSKELKEQLKQKEEELQAIKHSRARNLLIDFTGRCIIDDNFRKLNEENALLQEVSHMMGRDRQPTCNDNLDPKATFEIEPVYEPNPDALTGSMWIASKGRVQDKQVLEMSDIGVCLSMHQPWASLLVAGIKRHEGRDWYTAHRGRLWIASTSKIPTPEDIKLIQDEYRLIRGGDVKFPSKYLSKCLLGYVNLVECLPQEEYMEKYPTGEVDSPFVFICEDPTPCPVLFPIKGQPKIYKLDPKIHQAAAKCVQQLSSK